MFRIFGSIKTASILTALLMVTLLAGAVSMPLSEEYGSMNGSPLFSWLLEKPISLTWWLWLGIVLLLFTVINTLVCTALAILRKGEGKDWVLRLSPQIIHMGFCFIMLAHLLSSYAGLHGYVFMREGDTVRLDSQSRIILSQIDYRLNSGYITEMSAHIDLIKGGDRKRYIISPNNPAFHKGFGIYIQRVSFRGGPAALIEISRDPGALWALGGGVLFLLGTIALTLRKLQLSEV